MPAAGDLLAIAPGLLLAALIVATAFYALLVRYRMERRPTERRLRELEATVSRWHADASR